MSKNQNQNMAPAEKRAYRVKEATVAYRLSHSTIYKLMKAGKLRTVKIGGRRLIPRDVLEALISDGTR
jgi:excisionase family DNA binding protein